MKQVNIHEAKTHLSRLIEDAVAGEEVQIARAGKPVVRLVPIEEKPPIRFGSMRGQLHVRDDFDEPLPDDILDLFDKNDL